MSPSLLSKDAFASRTSLSMSSVNRYLSRGLVAYVRIGGRVLVPDSEVSRLCALARSGGTDAPVIAPVAVEQGA